MNTTMTVFKGYTLSLAMIMLHLLTFLPSDDVIVFGAHIDVTPSESIQSALDKADPGDVLVLADGTYSQDFSSVRHGTPEKRITIKGSRDAVIKGHKKHRMIEINHSYISLEGFTVSGVRNGGKKAEDYVDKCVYVIGTESPNLIRKDGSEYESSLDGLVLRGLHIKDCGGECVRLRSFVTNAEVVGNRIEGCGRHDFAFPSSTVNGEAIYIGTSSNQWDDGKNSKPGPDLTKYVWVHENVIDSQGNECVDVKEGTTDVVVEYNICSDQRDENSAGLDSRTDDIVFRYNEVLNCNGAGVRIGGHTIDGRVYGKNNEVYGNVFSNTEMSSVKIITGDDHNICDNECGEKCSTKASTEQDLENIEEKCDDEEINDLKWLRRFRKNSDSISDSEDVHENFKMVPETNSNSNSDHALGIQTEEIIEKNVAANSKQSKNPDKIDKEDPITCREVKIQNVTSSGNDRNINTARMAVDHSAITRWSSKGKDEWISVSFEKASLRSMEITFYKGDERIQYFDVYANGREVLLDQQSSGNSLASQQFVFSKGKTRKIDEVTIFGKGNSVDNWNSFSEIRLCHSVEGDDDLESMDDDDSADTIISKRGESEKEEKSCETFELPIATINASQEVQDHVVTNLLVRNMNSRWECDTLQGSPCDVIITLEKESYLAEFDFSVYQGDKDVLNFDIEVLQSGNEEWQPVISDGISQKTRGTQSIDIDVDEIQQVKFVAYGMETSSKNSLVFVSLIGC